ncbi:MAG: large conductance mechanosensitive channel protein MscL [Vicinamibacterales bacterium]
MIPLIREGVMLQEFKEFIVKGNAFDMAVGVIIGGAFGAVAGSFVNDIMMPPLGLVTGGTDFSNLFLTLKEGASPGPYASLAAAKEAGAVTVNVGTFINAAINLVLVGAALFLMIRAVNAARTPPPAPPPAGPPEDVVLLREIRDALKK